MDLPCHLHWSVSYYLRLSPQKRSCASRTANARRTRGGKGNNAKDHYALCFPRMDRASRGAFPRLSIRLVPSTGACRDCRRCPGCNRALFYFYRVPREFIRIGDDWGCRKPNSNLHWALRAGAPSPLCKRFALSDWDAACAWLVLGVPSTPTDDAGPDMAALG